MNRERWIVIGVLGTVGLAAAVVGAVVQSVHDAQWSKSFHYTFADFPKAAIAMPGPGWMMECLPVVHA